MKELRIENKAHQAAMDTVANLSQGLVGVSADEKTTLENESLKSQLQSAKQVNDDLKASHKGSMSQKNGEIKNLKNAVKVLEEELKNVNSECDIVKEKLKTSRAEVNRAQNITDLLVKKGAKSVESVVERQSIEPGLKNNDTECGKESVEKLNNTESKIPCLTLFKEGKCGSKQCARLHEFNLRKVKRGICVYEYASSGSCPWRDRCMYTHDIPPEICKEPKVIKDQKEKMKVVTERKKSNQLVKARTLPKDAKDSINSVAERNKLVEKEQPVMQDSVTKGSAAKDFERILSKKLSEGEDFYSGNSINLSGFPTKKGSDERKKKYENDTQKDEEYRPRRNSRQNDSRQQKSRSEMQDDDTHKTVNSFLQLIRPMLMDQVNISVKSCMETHKKEMLEAMGNMMTSQLIMV